MQSVHRGVSVSDITQIRVDHLDVQLHVGVELRREHFVPVKGGGSNTLGIKPANAFWTSTWDPIKQSSGWVDWGRGEDYGSVNDKEWQLYTPVGTDPVVLIHTEHDARWLFRRYSEEPWKLDFAAMIEDGFVGMHMTYEGQWATRHGIDCSLYGWDCESTSWFQWCFEDEVIPMCPAKNLIPKRDSWWDDDTDEEGDT